MQEKPEIISRRTFLKRSCLTIAAVGVLLAGGTALAATYTPPQDLPSSDDPETGEGTMENRILITYATKAGSTADIAMRMAETLRAGQYLVDVKPVKEVTDLSPYSTVIAGSAIRVGNILPEMTQFIQDNLTALQSKRFDIFIACMTLEKDTAENRATVSAYLDPVRAMIQPASEGLFAGVMDLRRLNLLEKLMMKAMKTPVGDFRNWEQINGWIQGISTGLVQ